jgi:AAHS family 4-hydroxybenzoate transporter-like MFS transporter
VIAKNVSAITGERYTDTHFWLDEPAAGAKGSISQLFTGRQLAITLMLWVVFFMSLLIIYLLSSWMPTLLNHRGIDLQHARGSPPPSRLAAPLARCCSAC